MNYYPHHIGDYRSDTAHLSLLEHGVYRQLIDWYYMDEMAIPADLNWVYRKLSARSAEEKNAVEMILADFFKKRDDGYHHKRCDDEIALYRGKAAIAQNNGKKGGRPKRRMEDSMSFNPALASEKPTETQLVILANPELTQTKPNHNPEITGSQANQEPRTKNQEPITSRELVTPSATPKRIGKRLADDWKPDREYWEAAQLIKPDMTQEWFVQVAHKFKDYWIAKAGKDATKADWLATWRNWIRREAENAKGGIGSTGKKSYGEQRSELFDSVTDYGRATNF